MNDPPLRIQPTACAIEVALHVQPRARRNEITGIHNGALKLKVVAPPVEDAANRAVVQFFASLLKIPKSRLTIISGQKSRDKVLRIEGISQTDLLSRLHSGLL